MTENKAMIGNKPNRENKAIQMVSLGMNLLLLVAVAWLYFERGPRIAYVKTNHLLSNYQGFKDASQAYKEKSSIWTANLDTLARELNVLKTKYESEKNKLSEKESALTTELINTKQQQLEQYSQGIRQKAAQEDREMTASVVQEINAFLLEYGEKNNYKIIFGATEVGNIVYAEEGIDLTEEVLEVLNRRYKGE